MFQKIILYGLTLISYYVIFNYTILADRSNSQILQ